MPIANEHFVRAALAAYEPTLHDAFHGAWEDWRNLSLGGKLKFVARSRACLVYDFIVQRVLAAVDGDARIHVVEGDETIKLIVDGVVALRFKKANESGLGSNIKTQATLEFVDSQQDLPGIPGVHKVEMVYVLNDIRTKMEQLLVVARDGDNSLWKYEVNPGRVAAVVQMPVPQPSNGDRGVRIKVRGARQGQQREAGEK